MRIVTNSTVALHNYSQSLSCEQYSSTSSCSIVVVVVVVVVSRTDLSSSHINTHFTNIAYKNSVLTQYELLFPLKDIT